MIPLQYENKNVINDFSIPESVYELHQACMQGFVKYRAWIDKDVQPEIAVVVAADYCYLLGNFSTQEPSHLQAMKLIEKYAQGRIVVPSTIEWKEAVCDRFSNQLRNIKRYRFKRNKDGFNVKQLNQYISDVADGYVLVPFDEHICQKALEQNWSADFCSNFKSVEQFLQYGLGYAILKDGEIIAGASSYSYSEGFIDITIGTVPEYRRKGLALACASKLIIECLNKGIYPIWDAANIESVALAEKLGYQFENEYDVYFIN